MSGKRGAAGYEMKPKPKKTVPLFILNESWNSEASAFYLLH